MKTSQSVQDMTKDAQDWLKTVGDTLGTDESRSCHAAQSVFCCLRDQLPVKENAKIAAALPVMIRGLYFSDWTPEKTQAKSRSRKKFIETVATGLNDKTVPAEEACRAVFKALADNIPAADLKSVRAAVAAPVLGLWPQGADDRTASDKDEDASGNGAKKQKHASPKTKPQQKEEANMQSYRHRDRDTRSTHAPYYEQSSGSRARPREDEDTYYAQRARQEGRYGEYPRGKYAAGQGQSYYTDERGYSDEFRAEDRFNGGYGQDDDMNDGAGYGADSGPRYGENDDRRYGRNFGQNPSRTAAGRGRYSPGYDTGADYEDSYRGRADEDMERGYRESSPSTRGRSGMYEYGPEGRYGSASQRGWNEGRRMAGNRQSYGYEDEDTRPDRWSK